MIKKKNSMYIAKESKVFELLTYIRFGEERVIHCRSIPITRLHEKKEAKLEQEFHIRPLHEL